MIVNTNGNLYFVRWQYGGIIKSKIVDKKGTERIIHSNPTTTSCIIRLDKEDIVVSTTRRHPDDVHDKEKARRLTLKRALETMVDEETPRFTKEERELFWKAYLDRKPTKSVI
jgi:hypothetical protein